MVSCVSGFDPLCNPKWHEKNIESTFADHGLFNFKNMDKLICHPTQKLAEK